MLRQANLLSFGHCRAAYARSCPRRLCDLLRRRLSWHLELAGGAIHRLRQDAPGAHRAPGEIRAGRSAHVADRCQRRRMDSVPARNGRRAGARDRSCHLEREAGAARSGSRAGSLIAGWSEGLPEYSPEAVEKQTGVPPPVINRLAHEMTQRGRGRHHRWLAVGSNQWLVQRACGQRFGIGDRYRSGGPILGFMPASPRRCASVPMRESLGASRPWLARRRRCCCSTRPTRFLPRRRRCASAKLWPRFLTSSASAAFLMKPAPRRI